MTNGIGQVQSGVGHIDLGQNTEPAPLRGKTWAEDAAIMENIIDSFGIGGYQTEKPKKVKAGTAEGAPTLNQARGKSDIEKFFSSVGKGIKSFFVGVADKLSNLFKADTPAQTTEPQPAQFARKDSYNLNLGTVPPADLSRQVFVPLSDAGAEGAEVPDSVSALQQLTIDTAKVADSLATDTDSDLKLVVGSFFRGKEPGIAGNANFVASHLDFRAIAEDIIGAHADQINNVAGLFDDYQGALGDELQGSPYSRDHSHLTPADAAHADTVKEELVRGIFDLAAQFLDALLSEDSPLAAQSDDLRAFTDAKMDVILQSDCSAEAKTALARSLLTNDLLLRGVFSGFFNVAPNMDSAAFKVVSSALDLSMSLVNGRSVHSGSNSYEPASQLFAELRDTYQGDRLDNFLVSVGLPPELIQND